MSRITVSDDRGSLTRLQTMMHAHADVILLSTGSGKTHKFVAAIHEAFPRAWLMVATDATKPEVAKAYSAGAAVVAPPRAFFHAVQNNVGSALTLSDSAEVEVVTSSSRHPIEHQVVAEFHDAKTGRLDAARVAEAYGVSLSAIARALGVTQSALSKRTTAAAAQGALRELEFAWAALLSAVDTADRVRAWLHTLRPDLGGKPPLSLLLEGSAVAFANYVRSVVTGEPG
jgi:predicted component of type VI protein secretion system